ncbi:hypothetical protein F4778DRAFT_753689 [Xylariomycetidae sp. FL2044]|nr:hypothetical protein F4778DRAFT_753689 [Xylariomycetidae sp. FL2044]
MFLPFLSFFSFWEGELGVLGISFGKSYGLFPNQHSTQDQSTHKARDSFPILPRPETEDKMSSTVPKMTRRETELVCLAFQCMKGDSLPIDWAKFAEKAGFKNVQSARATFNPIKKKLMTHGAGAAESTASTSGGASTAAPAKKKRGRKATTDEDADIKSPSKKAKKTTMTKVMEEAEEDDDEDVEEDDEDSDI